MRRLPFVFLFASALFGCGTTDDSAGDDGGDDADEPTLTMVPFGRATCVLGVNQKVKCFGAGAEGALGTGLTDDIGNEPDEMGDNLPYVDFGTDRTVLQLSGGIATVCALLDDYSVKCFGGNSHGSLGLGIELDEEGFVENIGDEPDEMGDNLAVIDLGTGVTAKQVSTGLYHSCVVTNDDRVKCWGDNMGLGLGGTPPGHLGDEPDEMGDNLPYVDIGADRTAKKVYAMDSRTCVLLDDDTLRCWGYNISGALGLGDVDDRGTMEGSVGDAIPVVDLGTDRYPLDIVGGAMHTCALLDDHTVKCWGGQDGFGMTGTLGLGDTLARGDEPGEMGDALPTVDLGTDRTALQIAAGTGHTCALLDDHTVKCWGGGFGVALGYGDPWARGDVPGEMGDALPPIYLGPERTAKKLWAGGTRTCALLDDDSVKCWGIGLHGMLGLGDELDRGDGPYEMGHFLPAVQLGSW